ncbi:MAG: hypothetical protein ACON35_06400 [Candidatus Marinamargulisbacteria bacterium]
MSILKKMVSSGFQRKEITQETILSCVKEIITLIPSTATFYIDNQALINHINKFELSLEPKGVGGVASTNLNRGTYVQLKDFEGLMNKFHTALNKTLNINEKIKSKEIQGQLRRTIQEFESMHKLSSGEGKNRNCSIL